MGAVYLAHDQRLDIECAIKEMSAALLKTEEERDRARRAFHEEAKLLARLSHPNLPRVSDHFSENGKEYLVMEYVPGETLAQVMRRNPPPWSVAEAQALVEPQTDVLQYLHTRQPPIIFRDLKPANVMRTPEGQIKLIDFGIARLFKAGQSHDTQAFGTMGYSAPEQYGQGQTDARSDVYALGMLVHQLISAHDPISQPFNVPLAHRLNPHVPEQFSAVLQTAMSHDAENRFASMLAFRRALLNAAGNVPSQPFVAAPRPAMPQIQPQVGYTQPQAGYNQPTPQRPQTYGPPASQPYNQPTPQQQLPSQPYPQAYGPPVQPVAYGMAPVYAQPYGPPPVRVETTGLAQTSRWMGIACLLMVLSSFVLPEISYGFASVVVLLGLLLAGAGFIVSVVGLNHEATKNSIKGRSHAGLGMALSIVALLLVCASLANLAKY
jgi:serine/threonine protein kinase